MCRDRDLNSLEFLKHKNLLGSRFIPSWRKYHWWLKRQSFNLQKISIVILKQLKLKNLSKAKEFIEQYIELSFSADHQYRLGYSIKNRN